MKLLLDTHVWLWMQVQPERIGPMVRELLTDPENRLFLSAASSWEISIKWSLGKLALPGHPPEEYIPQALLRQSIEGLPIEHRHTFAVADLPAHHRDPFDRLLVAQAQLDGLTLVTADPLITPYDVDQVWAAGSED